jgi:hypothetical protein
MSEGCAAKHHNTVTAYGKHGCRCPAARRAKSVYTKRRKHGLLPAAYVSALGTNRRLQALAALGWNCELIGAQIGYDKRMIAILRNGSRPQIHRVTADKVAAVYGRLCMTLGTSDRARREAQRKRWAPPLAWNDNIDDPAARPAGAVRGSGFDEVVVDRAVRGERGNEQLRRADAQEAIRRCRARGMPVSEITWRVGVSDRTVHRNAPLISTDTLAS